METAKIKSFKRTMPSSEVAGDATKSTSPALPKKNWKGL